MTERMFSRIIFWGTYAFVVLASCSPILWMLYGIRKNSNPEWHKWFPTWARWVVGKR